MENKNPSEQLGGVVNAWAEMQKRMWGDWASMLKNIPGGDESPVAAVKKGFEAASKGGNEAARALMDRISGSQSAMNRVMDFFFRSMKVVAPNLEMKKDWRPDLAAFADQWAKESTAMLQRSMGLGSHFGDFTNTLTKDMPNALGPWLSFLTQAASAGHIGEGMLGGTAGLSRLLAMESDASAIGAVGEIPHFGLSREKNAKMLRLVDASVDVRKASLEFHTAFAEALAKAVEATIEELGKLAAKGEKITTVRDLMRLWYRTADGSLLITFNSKEFLDIQNQFSLAQQQYKLAQRVVVEDIFRSFDIPTRTEVDEAYKVIHDLKKEVRALRKELLPPSHGVAAKAATVRKAARPKSE
ncbi:MAG TPA: poly(R)-hydroxyalkanoic acid synthase subunit PhaE [Accumulibacter sp.]|nr:poly(R)-hydroxyalkanoic acid synthase subunit PhaE [Accumulibacter sp.]HMW16918.1 poly(R)-hydroxyalkanoic acid synthase subunit PhaE [Accumulibacter sp.]HMX21464.1 poly(R)-hydroxyalkanoic acid synthase subunit PhaE [Accumulibacter sp.]HMY06933.1 poly(R)-hydroxyalkanoic acid synthase subunit PhaE [Accumulibacter sp.]HNC18740.1 poly(R)-hydroxyalkanoic acid synthase subunit PhaE [Accumulibacter sp.]